MDNRRKRGGSLSFFPSGDRGYESGYAPLGELLGRNRLILPGDFVDARPCSPVSYSKEQRVELVRLAPELVDRVRARLKDRLVVVIPGPPLLWTPDQVFEEFSGYFQNDDSAQSADDMNLRLGRLTNNRVGFSWEVFSVRRESDGRWREENTSDTERVVNIAEALWLFGLWRLCRGRYPIDPGKWLRVAARRTVPWGTIPKQKRRPVKYVRSLPLFPDEVVETTMLIGVEDGGIRLLDDDGSADSDVGTLFLEEVIRMI